MAVKISRFSISRDEIMRWIEVLGLAFLLVLTVTGGMILTRDWTAGGALYGEVTIPLLAGVLWVLATYFGRPGRLSRSIGLAIVSVVLAYAVSIATSVDFFLALVFSFPVLGLLFAYLAGLWAPVRLASLSTAVAAVGVVYALATLTAVWVEFRWRVGVVHALSGFTRGALALLPRGNALAVNPNVGAMTMLIPAGVALGGFLWSQGTTRAVAGLAAVTMGLGVVVTGSRGAVVALIVECGFMVVATTFVRGKRGVGGWLPRTGVSFGAIGLALAMATLPIFQARGFVRSAVWLASLDLVMQRPLTGWGPGSLAMLMPARFQDPTLFQPAMWHAHNMLLELTASLGVLGAVLIAGGFGLAWKFRVKRTFELSPRDMGLRLGAAAGVLGAAVQGLVESGQLYPGVLLLAGIAAAILSRSGGDRAEPAGVPSRVRISVVVVVGASALLGALLLISPAKARAAVAQGDLGDWVRASSDLEAGTGLPRLDSFSSELLAISEYKAGRRVAAEHWVEVSISEQPFEWTRWLLAAELAAARGDDELARSRSMRALELGAGSSPSGLMALLVIAQPNSDVWREESVRLVQEYPGVVVSEFWRSLDVDASLKTSAILDAAREGSSCELSIATGLDPQAATSLDIQLARWCEAEARLSAVKNPAKEEPDTVVQASGLYYAAVRNSDRVAAERFAADLAGFPRSPLARRVMGIQAMLEGNEQLAIESWSAAAVLGDLASVNLLLGHLPPHSAQTEFVTSLGWSIASKSKPIAILGGQPVPHSLRAWWSLETYAPMFLQGPLLSEGTARAEGSDVREFMGLVGATGSK